MLNPMAEIRDERVESRMLGGRFRGGKLAPVGCVPFKENEGGLVSQAVTFELDPIGGRVVTEMFAEVVTVFVPTQAIHAFKNPEADYPGNTEIVRDALMSGTPLFGLEDEGEISKRLGVVPRSINGSKKVNEAARLAYLAACAFLYRRKYVKAFQPANTDTAIQRALISQTTLDRFNGVLDPEDRVNGAVDFTGELPIKGLGINGDNDWDFSSNGIARQTGGPGAGTDGDYEVMHDNTGTGKGIAVYEDPDNPGYPKITASMDGANNISLRDFYTAERMDELTRVQRRLVDAYPQYGEEIAVRFAYGLSVDVGNQPIVLYEKRESMRKLMRQAMDGANLDVNQTDHAVGINFTVPVMRTELGGIMVTMAALKPDETLASQPHPILSAPWSPKNHMADELAIDPVPVTVRDLDADCLTADEENRMLYVGNNHLEKAYINYGWNRHLDQTKVENKTAMWQLQVPLSVNPESVLYPENLDHYPFEDSTAEVCTYTWSCNSRIATPTVFGPTPVEELAIIETENLFEDSEVVE